MREKMNVNGLASVRDRKHEEKGETHEAGRLRNLESGCADGGRPSDRTGDRVVQNPDDKSRNGPGDEGQGRSACRDARGRQNAGDGDPWG